MLLSRPPFEIDVERERGELYQRTVEEFVTNRFDLQIFNKSNGSATYQLSVNSALPLEILDKRNFTVEAGQRSNFPLVLQATPESIVLAKTLVTVELCDVSTNQCMANSSSFFGPLR